MKLAPIALFVYARPEHTRQTLESLAANDLAQDSELIVFADGPKANASAEMLANIQRTRELIAERKWCGKVTLIASDVNKGLAGSIVEGVTKVVNEHGRIIVLEDDLYLSPGFLRYMNEALELYQNDEKVMHISGYMFPVESELPATMFYNTASCWGWATWKRAWSFYNNDACMLAKAIEEKKLVWKFNIEGTHLDFYTQLLKNCSGDISTWAVKWYASIVLANGFALHPGKSLVRNIGHDGSGINSSVTQKFDSQTITEAVNVERISIVEHDHARKAMQKYYLNLYPSTRGYIQYQIKKLIQKFK